MRNADSASWRELCRFEDAQLAGAVTTSIASMEFDVRLIAAEHHYKPDDDDRLSARLGRPPYIIEVNNRNWSELDGVLTEIIDEQVEFDRTLEVNRATRGRVQLVVIVTLTGVVEVLAILRLIEL